MNEIDFMISEFNSGRKIGEDFSVDDFDELFYLMNHLNENLMISYLSIGWNLMFTGISTIENFKSVLKNKEHNSEMEFIAQLIRMSWNEDMPFEWALEIDMYDQLLKKMFYHFLMLSSVSVIFNDDDENYMESRIETLYHSDDINVKDKYEEIVRFFNFKDVETFKKELLLLSDIKAKTFMDGLIGDNIRPRKIVINADKLKFIELFNEIANRQ